METKNIVSNPKNIIISGGGTGGHLFPALAIRDEIVNRYPNTIIHYIGSQFGIEKDVLPIKNISHSLLPIRGLQRGISLESFGKNLLLPLRFFSSNKKVKKLFNDIKPNLVIGTGGYAAALPLREGIKRGIPTLIQEQNSYPGITTRWFADKATKVCIAFEDARKYLKKKCTLTGNPVRKEINRGNRIDGIQKFGFDPSKKILFVFGGSQGSLALNKLMNKMISSLSLSSIQVIWQTGKKFYKNYENHESQALKVLPFIEDMASAYAVSDLVMSRSGAISCSELTVCGKPSILIPFPDAAADHQTKNAKTLVNHDAALMFDEKNLHHEKIAMTIQSLLTDENRLNQMSKASFELGKPNATDTIVDEAMGLIK